MTYPGEQPPTTPPQQQYWPPQQPAYGPPPGWQPPPPVKPPNPKLVFWTSAPGVISMLAIMGVLVLVLLGIINRIQGPASDRFDLTVTSCSATTGTLPTATVSFTIKNTSSRAASATVEIQYRDGSGARLDTDTAYVTSIRPGETVRHDESTLLDGTASGELDCQVKVAG